MNDDKTRIVTPSWSRRKLLKTGAAVGAAGLAAGVSSEGEQGLSPPRPCCRASRHARLLHLVLQRAGPRRCLEGDDRGLRSVPERHQGQHDRLGVR